MSTERFGREIGPVDGPAQSERELLAADYAEIETRLPHVPFTYTDERGWLVAVNRFALPVAHEQRHVYDESDLPAGGDTPRMILNAVSDIHGIEIDKMQNGGRQRDVLEARHDAMYLMWKMTEQSYPAVGKELGGYDHTTVMNAKQKVEQRLEQDAELADRHAQIVERLRMYQHGEFVPEEMMRLEQRITALIEGGLYEFKLRELTQEQRVGLGVDNEFALDGDSQSSSDDLWERHGAHAQEALTSYREGLRAEQIARMVWPNISMRPLQPHISESNSTPQS